MVEADLSESDRMPDLRFESSLSMEEIENNFKDADLFSGIMAGLQDAVRRKERIMNPNVRAAYSSVYVGWWPILDEYIPRMLELDPDCEFIVKEKYGTLRLRPYKITNGHPWKEFYAIGDEAELASEKVCEFCGAAGKLRQDRFWWKTLCDRCAGMDPDELCREGRHNVQMRLDEMEKSE